MGWSRKFIGLVLGPLGILALTSWMLVGTLATAHKALVDHAHRGGTSWALLAALACVPLVLAVMAAFYFNLFDRSHQRELALGMAGKRKPTPTWRRRAIGYVFLALMYPLVGLLHTALGAEGLVIFIPLFGLLWWGSVGLAVVCALALRLPAQKRKRDARAWEGLQDSS